MFNSNMEYAIIEHNGKQFWVQEGKYYHFNYIPIQPGEQIILKRVLLVRKYNLLIIGKPYLKSILIKGKILKHLQSKKTFIYKIKSKKKTRKKQAYRQQLTRVLIKEFVPFSPDYKFFFGLDIPVISVVNSYILNKRWR